MDVSEASTTNLPYEAVFIIDGGEAHVFYLFINSAARNTTLRRSDSLYFHEQQVKGAFLYLLPILLTHFLAKDSLTRLRTAGDCFHASCSCINIMSRGKGIITSSLSSGQTRNDAKQALNIPT